MTYFGQFPDDPHYQTAEEEQRQIERERERVIEEQVGEQYRVFCDKHDLYRARYTNGRPLVDDRCPWCVVEELRQKKAGTLGFMPCDLV